jgi:ElaB/YqjD/DUF883 family membrane-anchored ribosome-binding protein
MNHQDRKVSHLEDTEHFVARMKEKSVQAEKELKKAADNVDKYIKKHPVKSTIIAGVAGLLLGKFLSK